MTDRHLTIKDVVIDCDDPERVARFWSELLGRPISGGVGPYVWLERSGGLGMAFQKVTGPKTGKNRLHLDLGSPDPAGERRRIESLGGRALPEYADGGFLVMADPEGNEFCVIPDGPFDVDDQGRASYVSRA